MAEKKQSTNTNQTTQSKSKQRRQEVVSRKQIYFVPELGKSVKANNRKDLEQVVKSERNKQGGMNNG